MGLVKVTCVDVKNVFFIFIATDEILMAVSCYLNNSLCWDLNIDDNKYRWS